MPHNADHVADKNYAELYRLSKLYEFPSFVKQADINRATRPQDIAVTAYADPVRKQFPCHNAASTWLSVAFFTEKKAEFHGKDQARIQQHLDHYVNYWRIGGAVKQFLDKHAEYYSTETAKLPDSSFAWVNETENGVKDRRLPLRNTQEVKAACDWMFTYRDQIPFESRHIMAGKILAKAARFGASLGDKLEFVEKQAGHGVCDPAEVTRMLRERAYFARNEELKNRIVKLAIDFDSNPNKFLQPQVLVKLAETVDTVDRSLGLVGKYTDKIPRPEDVIFKATFTKVASDLNECCAMTSGTIYKTSDLARIPLEDIRSLFGGEFASEVTKQGMTPSVDAEKLAELAVTLPRGDAELFDKLAGAAGVTPHLKKAASAPTGFSPKVLMQLAAAYENSLR